MPTKFIAYYRVSTDRQGKSGLGLESQRETVAAYIKQHDGEIIAEFTEVESGRKSNRPQLEKALAACRLHRATLVVSKVDRLTRSVSFMSRLLDSGAEVRFADLPQIEGATGRFLLHQMVSVAELEAGMISTRTKAALTAAKARGVKLGGTRNLAGPSDHARRRATEAVQRGAVARAADVRPTIEALQADGVTSLRGIADALNAARIPTARGCASWGPGQVRRVLNLQR